MNTNDNTNNKVDTQNKEEAIAEVSATEAETIAGGTGTVTGTGIVPVQQAPNPLTK